MAKRGHRYPLILYRLTLDRWWKTILWTGIGLLLLAGGLWYLPGLLPQYPFTRLSPLAFGVCVGIGGFAIVVAVVLLTLRRSAYVQPCESYLLVLTPFLRLKISYRRIHQVTSTEMQNLFPPEKARGWRRKFLRPLAGYTAVAVEMNGWPLSPTVLHLFLSPFFFPYKTAVLALLIPHWMEFSTELDSLRTSWMEAVRQKRQPKRQDLYSSVTRSR